MFFVISGYLITSIIFKKLVDGSFSFKEFWLRRLKRLFPALLCMVAVVMIAGSVILIQPERGNLPLQAIATIFSFNNILLWKTTSGYWSTASENIPFLHTWSLSVEEQFYFCFPFILFLLFSFRRKQILIYFILLFFVSISLFVYGVKFHHSDAAFYLLPTRMWELLSGSILALFPWYQQKLRVLIHASWVAILGFLLLLFSLYKIIDIPSSSYNLLVCVGAVLVIQNAHTKGIINKFLTLKYVVQVGKISYSLYLWHWPVIVFAKYLDTQHHYIISLLSIFSLSIISYHFVEKPIRYGAVKLKHALIPIPAVVIACVVVYTVFPKSPLIYGLGNIDSEETLTRGWEFEATDLIREGHVGVIFNEKELADKKPIVVFGSSHARVLCSPIKKIADQNNLPFVSMSTSGIGVMSDAPTKERPDADLINKKRFNDIKLLEPAILIVGGMWSGETNVKNFQDNFVKKMEYLLKYSGRVLVVGQVPLIKLPKDYKDAMRKYLVAKNNSNDKNGVKCSQAVTKANAIVKKAVQSINNENIIFVNPYELFISEHNMVVCQQNGKFLYSDYHHVNDAGATLIVDKLIKQKVFSWLQIN